MAHIKKLDLNDPDTKSADIVAGNIDALKALFPEAFTEGKIDFEVLKGLLGAAVDERDEKYGLNWHGKRRARQIALAPSTGTLLPCPEESVDWDKTQNLMIEGDNLEVLKLLQKSYAGKVKLIYIDPPYNTGNDFVYPDDFVDSIGNYLQITGQTEERRPVVSNPESSGRFHTAWLNMMYPRLKLARSLLREDGVIFVSIDDGEINSLRSNMNEIFGEENFLCQITVQSNPRGRQSEIVATTHEYLLGYSRSVDDVGSVGQALNESQKEQYQFSLPDGRRFRIRGLRHRGNASRRVDRPNMYFPIYVDPQTRRVSLDQSEIYTEEVFPRKSTGEDGRWEWGPDTARARIDRLEGVFISTRNEWDVYQREFLEDENGGTRSTKWKTIWNESDINYQNAKNELKELFKESPFEFPKPLQLLKKLVEGATSGSDAVLDFFAGSGTTAHAVMAQNALDLGARRFILVQLPETLDASNKSQELAAMFCEGIGKRKAISELTKERIRRAATKVKGDNPLFSGDLGFRSFKLGRSNIRAWEPDSADLENSLLKNAEHLVQGREEQDVLYELLLKHGLDLCVPIEEKTIAGKSVHSIGGGALIVCLAEVLTKDVIEPLAAGIISWRAALAPAVDTRVVFKDSGFADDIAKTNMAAILNQNGITDVRSL